MDYRTAADQALATCADLIRRVEDDGGFLVPVEPLHLTLEIFQRQIIRTLVTADQIAAIDAPETLGEAYARTIAEAHEWAREQEALQGARPALRAVRDGDGTTGHEAAS